MSPPHSATRTTLGPLLALLALCGPLSAQWDEDFEEDAPPAFWEGRLSLRALAREGRGVQQDRDLYGRLRLRGGRASRDAWTFGLAARGAWDADGATPGGDAFGSLQDGRGGRFDPRLDEAWAAYHELPAEASLRLGRQTRRDTPVMLHFDGGQLELPFAVGDAAGRVELYGGVPEHRWEGSRSGDRALGLVGTLGAWHGGSLRLDALHLQDEWVFGRRSNTLLGLRASHASSDGRLGGSAAVGTLDGEADQASVDTWWGSSDGDLRLQLSARVQLATRADETLELASYATLLREVLPYQEASAMLAWEPSAVLLVDLGLQGRRLVDDAPSEFNREYQRGWIAAALRDALGAGTAVSAGLDAWDSGRDRIVTGNAELSAEGAAWRAALATGFSLYQFDFFSGRERTRVRAHTLELRRELGADWELRLRLGHEHDEVETYRTLLLGLEVRF